MFALCSSYGNVFKAQNKRTGEILAIKTVPVEDELQEIIKEITIMQQCDSPYIVKYFGSYFKNSDLWVSYFKKVPSFISEVLLLWFLRITGE